MPTSIAPTLSDTTVELGSLLRQYQLELVLITDPSDDAAALPVQWVHGSDMLDPSPFFTPRTVLLTTGTQFAGELAELQAADYVERLRDAGVTALGFGIGIEWDRIPFALIAACEQQGLPLFRVPYATP